jgi:hypothetical protein
LLDCYCTVWYCNKLYRDDGDELGSLYNPGSKKQNISYLLNFQFAPRGGQSGGRGRHGGGRRDRETHLTHYTPPKPRYDTSHYLQANCQFIVKSGADYSSHSQDPDILVDWDLIQQLILKQSGCEPTACPICLFPPTAAQVSRCGHVYCWACILHYLALSDEQTRKCPICDQAIARQDLRSVLVLPQTNLTTGSTVEMRLMKRERDSLFAVPADCTESFTHFPSVQQAGTNRRFIKMFQASAEEVNTNILARERRELELQWRQEKDQPESCFIQEAMALLASREESGLMMISLSPSVSTSSMKEEMPQLELLTLGSTGQAVDPFQEEVEEQQEVEEEIFTTTEGEGGK